MDVRENAEEAMKTVINCESTVDIKYASELYQHLKMAIEHKHHEVVINAGQVNRIDAAILQVLTAFALEAKAQKIELVWNGVSDAFRRAADLLDVSRHLELPA